MIKACGYNLVVELHPTEKVSAGGIILAKERVTREQEASMRATVLDVGPDAFKDYSKKPWCKVGDTIIVQKYSGVKTDMLNPEDLVRIIRDVDVLGLVEDTK